jgi:hypothetical protein
MPTSFINFFSSLSFGGIVGGLVSGILFLNYPQFFGLYLSFENMMLFGGILGASIHRLFYAVIIKGILHPIGKTIIYYEKLGELQIQLSNDLMDEHTYKLIKNKLDEEYFLGTAAINQTVSENHSPKLLEEK